MKIMFINNFGGGFADFVEVSAGLAVAELFRQRIGDGDPGDFLIRVNRLPVTADQVLQENDRVSITPVKVEGAAR